MFRPLLSTLLVGLALALPTGKSPRSHNNELRSVDQIIKEAGKEETTGKDGSVLVEMDMKMDKEYYEYLHGRSKIDPRKGLRDDKFRWTDKTIPYAFDPVFNDYEKGVIRGALDEWEKYTCLKMVPWTNQKNYVNVISASGCWSWVGMQDNGKQELSLDIYGCVYHHTAVHEFGHAVGFHHEQTRPDRDEFVKIYEDNIQSGQEYNFEKYDRKLIDDHGVTYDYWSVMHYGAYAFSGTGRKTIQTLNKDFEEVIGTVPGLSFKDIQLANLMYKCDSHCKNECPKKAIRSKDCKCWCNNLNPTTPVVEWDGVSECKGGDDFNDTCIDFHSQCSEWAGQGECDANPGYMLINCRKACKICGEDAVCKDYNKDCEYWAMIGECSANPGFMTLHCRKACKVCGDDGGGPEPGSCEDRWDQCGAAAAQGDCETYASSMLWECPVSCRACGNDAICRNWDILCPTWADMGECEKNTQWMERFCPRACKKCQGEDVPDCKNYHKDADCDYWANSGECALNPGFMLYKCTKSCRLCGDKADCLNYSPNCYLWKEDGLCETDKPGMHFNCPLACNKCTGDGLDKEGCENHDFNCEFWEKSGECDANPSFMLYYCPRSCHMCGEDQVCKNFHEMCEKWASEGECEKNPGYMELHCRQACGLCTPSGGSTVTKPTSTTPGSMPKGCHDELPEKCEDDVGHLEECPRRAANGECDSNPSEMYRICQKSCQMCGPDVLCKNYNPSCKSWAETGQCDMNPGYMYIFCRQSCKCC